MIEMTKFLDVYVGGARVSDVDDIIPPSEEKPLWLIIRNGRVVACASKGARVEYRKGETVRWVKVKKPKPPKPREDQVRE